MFYNNQGIGAVVGALSRNLTDVQDQQGSYMSIYDDPSIVLKVFFIFMLFKPGFFFGITLFAIIFVVQLSLFQ